MNTHQNQVYALISERGGGGGFDETPRTSPGYGPVNHCTADYMYKVDLAKTVSLFKNHANKYTARP